MDPIEATAASAMRAKLESLEMLANNLANAATSGFKADYEQYNLYRSPEADADPFSLPDEMPLVERPWTDFSQGNLHPTGNPLDVALSGKGFFAVNGPSGPLYTRNGAFQVSSDGRVLSSEGYAVRLAGGGALQVNANQALEIATDGTIRQDSQSLGKLDVVDFPNASAMNKAGRNYFAAADPNIIAVPATSAEVHQGKLEDSNSGTPEAAVRLVGIMRQFEMLHKAVALGNEMNRKAIDTVAAVGN